MTGTDYTPSIEQRVARALRVVDEAMRVLGSHAGEAVVQAKLEVVRMMLEDIAPGVTALPTAQRETRAA